MSLKKESLSKQMAVRIQEVSADMLTQYAEVSPAFEVKSILKIVPVNSGLGGLELREERVVPSYMKYAETDDDTPSSWQNRFDVSQWGVFLAFDGARAVGGAAVTIDPSGVAVFEGRSDLAGLWDIRIRPDERGRGIGTKLFMHAADWAEKKGCRQLRIETQNVNVPACRFYVKQGCELGGIERYGYASCSDVADEVMLLWYLDL